MLYKGMLAASRRKPQGPTGFFTNPTLLLTGPGGPFGDRALNTSLTGSDACQFLISSHLKPNVLGSLLNLAFRAHSCRRNSLQGSVLMAETLQLSYQPSLCVRRAS